MAGVALSTLRVTTDGDASGYVRMAAQKVAADQQMIASDKARNASLAQADAALAKIPGGMASVSKALLDGYGAGAQFEAIVRRIGSAVDRGMGLDRANQLLDAAYQKFGLTANAAVLAEKGFVSITGAVSNLNAEYAQLALAATSAAAAVARTQAQQGINESFGIGTEPGKSAQESADAFMAQYGGLEGLARAKAQEAGQAFSTELDTRLIAGAGKSARDAAATFEAQFVLDNQKAQQAGANFQRSLTEALGGGGPAATSQGATYSALAEQIQKLDQIEQARAAHVATSTQQAVAQAYGIDLVGKSARESASAFMELDAAGAAMAAEFDQAIAAENDMVAAAEKLRSEINPLQAEFNALGKQMAGYRAMLDANAISSVEFEQAQGLLAKRLTDVQQQLRTTGGAGRVASGELVNLSYQLNDVVTGLALGQSPFMILAQQGGQVFQIFQNSKAGILDFASAIGSKFMGLLSIGNIVFGGIATAIGLALAALNSFVNKEDAVKLGLSGAGRGSGATVQGINSTANAGASPFGLSVSSARELATALASTGKIANDNLLPIVQIGKDLATTFGISDTDAMKQLATAFSDPVRGAEQLNDRLGFLDAGMQRQLASLMAQNRLYDAQKLLLAGVQGSLAKTADVTSVWSQAWTALKNSASNVFDFLGEKLAAAGGLNASLTQQKDQLEKVIASYDELSNGGSIGGGASLEELKRKLGEINALLEKQALATNNVAAAQASLRVSQTIMNQLPEIGARQALADAASIGGATSEDPILMKALGLTQSQVDRAKTILNQLKSDFKTTFDEIQTNSKIAYDAVTAFSPSAKASIAQRQAQEQYRTAGGLDPSEKAKIGQDAYTLSIKQTTTALSEAARVRALTANQNVQTAQLEIDLLGKNIGQQAELRANLQARQQLEQEASQNRTAFDNAQYERLKKINAEDGKRVQLAAVAAMNDNIKFGANTSLLSPDDVQIAQQLRGIYPDVAQALASVQATGLRANQALSGLSSTISTDLTTGIADVVDGTKSLGQSFTDTSKLVIRAIEEMIIKLYIIGPLMRGLQSGFSLFTGTPAVGTAGSEFFGPVAPSAYGNVFAGGNIIPFASGGVVNRPTMFPMARGATGLMGEAGPEAVMPLRRGSDGKLGVGVAGGGAASGGGNVIQFSGGINIQVPEGTSPTDSAAIARSVKDTMTQVVDERIAYHSRPRGLLNR